MKKNKFAQSKAVNFILFLITCCIVFSECFSCDIFAADTTGISYIIYESDTKQTLEKHNTEVVADCSLLARLMTCLLVYENPSLSVTDYVTPTENSTSLSGRYSLTASNQYMVDHLLKAVILCNADNAARVLAEKVNPNKEYFVSLMNQKAIEIGLKNTYFTNPDGSPDELQRTTVNDMSVFLSYAMSNVQFRNVAANPAAHIWGGTAVINECKLVSNNTFANASVTSGALAVYNTAENLSTTMLYFVSTQTNNTPAVKLTMVISGISPESAYEFGVNFINNVFLNYKKTAIVKKGDTLITTKVGRSDLLINANETRYCMIPADVSNYVENISYNITQKSTTSTVPGNAVTLEDLDAPIEKDSIIGTANYLLKDGSIHSVSIVAGNSVHSDNKAINLFYKTIQENTDIFILISVLILLEIFLVLIFIINKLRNK